MEEDYQAWLTMMFFENCIEREEDGIPPFKSVEDYTQRNYNWLQKKYREKIE